MLQYNLLQSVFIVWIFIFYFTFFYSKMRQLIKSHPGMILSILILINWYHFVVFQSQKCSHSFLVVSVPTDRPTDIFTFTQQAICNTVSRTAYAGLDIYRGIRPLCLASGLHKHSECKLQYKHPQEKAATINQRCLHGNYAFINKVEVHQDILLVPLLIWGQQPR